MPRYASNMKIRSPNSYVNTTRLWSGCIRSAVRGHGGKGRVYRPFSLLIPLLLPLPGLAENMTVAQILAQGCTATPSNFSLNSEWNNRMQVIASFCNYPSITQADVNGLRKPKAFVTGSPENQHDRWGAAILAGDGAPPPPEDLGIAPNTDIVFGEYCTDAAPLQTEAQNGDVIFTMRAWSESCAFLNPDFKTIPIVGIDNEHRFIGDTRLDDRILVTFGSNYGQAIDYFTTGSRRISYTTPEFAGIVVALNSALIESNHPPLTMQNIKNVLDDSSDEVYLEVGGYRNVYKEYQVDSLMQDPTNKYFGQVINLANAILNITNNLEESYYWRGMARQAQGQTDQARADFQTALKYNRNFALAAQALESLP